MTNRFTAIGFALAFLFAQATQAEDVGPNSEYSPQQVVEIVLGALANNDSPHADAGIETTFRFAAPSNKRNTGPIERFKVMVKGAAYRDLINHKVSEFGKIKVAGRSAYIPILLSVSDGRTAAYMFKLGQQSEAPYTDAWMTEAVYPIDLINVDPDSGVSASLDHLYQG